MPKFPAFGRDSKVNALLGAGHFLSHYYQLCLPPVFVAWQKTFDVSFAELGLAMAVMSAAAALLQTPMGFLVDRYGARPFLVGGTLTMALSVSAMGFATSYWQIVALALLSGVGNSVIHPADYFLLWVGIVPMAQLMTVAVLFVGGLMTGASRTPRDVMVKDAAPAGQIGKVFGFVSSGMSLGGAIMPVPYGMLIDAGRPRLVLVVVAALLMASLLCAGGARIRFRRPLVPAPAE